MDAIRRRVTAHPEANHEFGAAMIGGPVFFGFEMRSRTLGAVGAIPLNP